MGIFVTLLVPLILPITYKPYNFLLSLANTKFYN